MGDWVEDLDAAARPRDAFGVKVFDKTAEDIELLATVTGREGAKMVSTFFGVVEVAAVDFGREALLLAADVVLGVDAESAATADLLKFSDDIVGVLRIRFFGGGNSESLGGEEPLFDTSALMGDVKPGFGILISVFDIDDEPLTLEEGAVVLVALVWSSSSKTIKATSVIS